MLDLVIPRTCPVCAARLHLAAGRVCRRCARSTSGLRGPTLLGGAPVLGLGPFDGPLRSAVHRLKYHGEVWRGPSLGRLAAELHGPELDAIDAVLPVPLHRRRLRARGYNQAALLGRGVSRSLGVPMRVAGLRRNVAGRSFAGLPRAERVLRPDTFEARRVEGLRVVLVDDVVTTGTTLGAAAAAARSAGATLVAALVIAVADDSDDAGRPGLLDGMAAS